MKNLNFLFLFLFPIFLFAQSPEIIWEKTIGNSKNDEANKIILTKDHHYLLVGYTQPEGRYDLDVLVCKINPAGELIWKKNFGTTEVEIGYDVAEDDFGNFIITGRANTLDASGQIWVLKINTNGEILWKKKYGGLQSDAGKSIVITKHSQIIIGGNQEGEATTINHAHLLVLDKKGNKIKASNYGGDFFQKEIAPEDADFTDAFSILKGETCNHLIPSKSGGYLFVGSTITKARKNLATDGWLVKLDEDGQLIWDKAFGAIGGDNLFAVMENNEGEIFTIGEHYDKPNGRISIYWTKFDALGNILLEKQFGEKNFSIGKAGLLLENEEMLVCGFTSNKEPSNKKLIKADTISSFQKEQLEKEGWNKVRFKSGKEKKWILFYEKSFPLTEAQKAIKTDRDIWLGKIDANGNLLWKKTFGAEEDEEALSMILDHEHNLVITGYTRSKGKGLKDVWILKLKM